MREVGLSDGSMATVDDTDYAKVQDISWFPSQYGYPRGRIELNGKRIWVLMHRYILDIQPGDPIRIDHWNDNKLCNERWNLRPCTISQNNMSRPSPNVVKQSRYKGVCKNRKKWRATIWNNGEQIRLGTFEDEHDAAKAYNDKALEIYGEFAYLNILEEKQA